ncbi:hypothetical protein CP967_04080 [Streptomyces nitrosporeus]|uniref:Transposase n=1 Tax=Streptomyces nitrosporeus TaxID=28894 RepID=A0A5J6FJ70_9ACTN|nr:hypothetical protein CP967_04080 [Streptomyces nitrosporeus]
MLHRVRTGVQWHDLPGGSGPRKTVCERHRLRSAGRTWGRPLQQVQAADETDWDISSDEHRTRARPSDDLLNRPSAEPVGRHASRPVAGVPVTSSHPGRSRCRCTAGGRGTGPAWGR